MLAKTGYAPVSFWLGQPLKEIQRWIVAHNNLLREDKT
nr:MAG TPA: hypothetical protein [Caudoviricetes sp.]